MIDWTFISQLEGGQVLHGYVPDAANSRSGVTIATGFDLGGRTRAGMRTLLGDDHSVIPKVTPYLGLRGPDAVAALAAAPLHITASEAGDIDRAAKAGALNRLRRQYDTDVAAANQGRAAGDRLLAFNAIPDRAQTVIASVTFQYGTPWARTPNFWQLAVSQDWAAVEQELRNFGDRYPTRRRREAEYLAPIVLERPQNNAQNNAQNNVEIVAP